LQNIKKKGFEIEIQTSKTKRLELRASYQEQSYSELAEKNWRDKEGKNTN